MSKLLRVLAWSIGLTVVLAAMLGAATTWLVARMEIDEQRVHHTRAVQNQIAQVFILVQQMETSQRGYLLTGRDLYLDGYNEAANALPPLVDETARLVADNPRQQSAIADLRRVITDKMGELRSTIDEQQAGRTDAARAIVNSDRGLLMMAQISRLVAEMMSEEDRLLIIRKSAARDIGAMMRMGAATAFLLICALGALTGLYVRRSLAELAVAQQRSEQSQRRLQVAMDAAYLGSWQYDPVRRVVSGDTRSKEILGVAENEAPLEEIMERANPNDLAKVWAAFNAVHDPAESKRSTTEFRLRRDGKVRWVETLGLAQREGVGGERQAVGVVGTVADITERKHHEELLQRQADLLDQSHDAILTLQTDGRGIVYWSRGAERLYGYTAAEALGRRTHELLQTRAPIAIEEIDAQILDEGSWYGELTHTTREGRDIVVESRIVRVAYDGETFALETNRDITERKRAEEQVRLLMSEMSHRAKNVFSVVNAIAHQTATKNPEEFIERFSERIHALSANQELLVRHAWKGVEVEELVHAQLAHFADLIGHRIVVHGPKLHLKAAGAQAIGLALHELATNAGKYGALSTNRGHVEVRWGSDRDAFTMSWAERDGPPVSAPQRRGFGTIVMEAMAESSVDGTVDIDYAPAGLSWRLTCPAANALESSQASKALQASAGGQLSVVR